MTLLNWPKKFQESWGYRCSTNCHQGLSKIAQSGHTGYVPPARERNSFSADSLDWGRQSHFISCEPSQSGRRWGRWVQLTSTKRTTTLADEADQVLNSFDAMRGNRTNGLTFAGGRYWRRFVIPASYTKLTLFVQCAYIA